MQIGNLTRDSVVAGVARGLVAELVEPGASCSTETATWNQARLRAPATCFPCWPETTGHNSLPRDRAGADAIGDVRDAARSQGTSSSSHSSPRLIADQESAQQAQPQRDDEAQRETSHSRGRAPNWSGGRPSRARRRRPCAARFAASRTRGRVWSGSAPLDQHGDHLIFTFGTEGLRIEKRATAGSGVSSGL